MTNEKQTVAYDELEEGKRYYSSTTEAQEVLEVVLIEDDRMIFDECDDDFNDVGTYPRKKWNPNRWKPVDDTQNGPSLNEL